MYDLMSYLQARVQALLNRNKELEEKIQQLETYIFELCDKDCPDEYKHVIKTVVFKDSSEV
jgi:uncharacterized protein YutD